MTQETQMLLGLFLGILVMIVLVLKTRTHTFIALLLAALIIALVGRMSPADAITAIQDGFGNTLKSTGIIMLITGAGGALGNVVKVSGIGEVLGELADPGDPDPGDHCSTYENCTWFSNCSNYNSCIPDSTTCTGPWSSGGTPGTGKLYWSNLFWIFQ